MKKNKCANTLNSEDYDIRNYKVAKCKKHYLKNILFRKYTEDSLVDPVIANFCFFIQKENNENYNCIVFYKYNSQRSQDLIFVNIYNYIKSQNDEKAVFITENDKYLFHYKFDNSIFIDRYIYDKQEFISTTEDENTQVYSLNTNLISDEKNIISKDTFYNDYSKPLNSITKDNISLKLHIVLLLLIFSFVLFIHIDNRKLYNQIVKIENQLINLSTAREMHNKNSKLDSNRIFFSNLSSILNDLYHSSDAHATIKNMSINNSNYHISAIVQNKNLEKMLEHLNKNSQISYSYKNDKSNITQITIKGEL